jgi:hypothetical protein
MLKGILLTGFFYIFFITSFSQTISSQRKEDMNIKKFHKALIILNAPKNSISIPIHSIFVRDARPDSSAIGLCQLLGPRFIATRSSFREASEAYIKKYVHCSKSDSFSVVMVLKKCWISTDVHKLDDHRLQDIEVDTSKRLNLSLFTNIEFYLFRDSCFYALYRFDSVFSAEYKKPPDIAIIAGYEQYSFASVMVEDALEKSLSKLTTMNWDWKSFISTKRKFTWQQIEAHEHQIFEIPVLKDSLPVPGVYLTFEEFKSNSPSITEFEITKDKLNDFIYVKQSDGRQIALMDTWGYCDSSNQIFVRSDHNYFKLQRRQNAFYIYGSNRTVKEIVYQPGGFAPSGTGGYTSVPAGGSTSTDFTLELKPFQLDWDTGKMY